MGVIDRYGEGREQQGRFICTLPRRMHAAIDRLRDRRNGIAIIMQIFNKGPTSKYKNLLATAVWRVLTTEWLIRHLSQVQQTIGRRPRIWFLLRRTPPVRLYPVSATR
jgi:hypothetical protein